MKYLAMLLITIVSGVALGAGPYRGSYLQREVGKGGQSGIATSCELFDNYPDLNWEELKKEIQTAAKAAENENNYKKRTYVQFNPPGVKYTATLVHVLQGGKVETKQVLLISDDGSYKGLKTDEAMSLVSVLDKACGNGQPKPSDD